jgi:hypothetical protein
MNRHRSVGLPWHGRAGFGGGLCSGAAAARPCSWGMKQPALRAGPFSARRQAGTGLNEMVGSLGLASGRAPWAG